MKQTGLMFKGELVRAILEGRKTQTRRVMKPQPATVERWKHGEPTLETSANWTVMRDASGKGWSNCGPFRCPYGKTGDLIYVRENFYQDGQWCLRTGCEPDDPNGRFWSGSSRILFAADCGGNLPPPMDSMSTWRSRPSIHMPKWAARIWLEIAGVRVERLQDISNEDALAEGVNRISHGREGYFYSAIRNDQHPKNWCYPDDAFRELWDSTGGDWSANPWVWVIDFKRTNKPAAH